jgi:hypothetical protein
MDERLRIAGFNEIQLNKDPESLFFEETFDEEILKKKPEGRIHYTRDESYQDQTFNFRYDENIKNALKKLAKYYGLSRSSYLKMAILRDFRLIESPEE